MNAAASLRARQRKNAFCCSFIYLELGPGSRSPHGQVLSNACLTSAIGMLGQKILGERVYLLVDADGRTDILKKKEFPVRASRLVADARITQ